MVKKLSTNPDHDIVTSVKRFMSAIDYYTVETRHVVNIIPAGIKLYPGDNITTIEEEFDKNDCISFLGLDVGEICVADRRTSINKENMACRTPVYYRFHPFGVCIKIYLEPGENSRIENENHGKNIEN